MSAVFMCTSTSGRGGIGISFKVYSLEKTLELWREQYRKHVENGDRRVVPYGVWRYCILDDGYTSKVSEMSLNDYEQIFEGEELEEKIVMALFKKEVRDVKAKATMEAEKEKKRSIPRIPKALLEPGRVYLDEKGVKYIYLGKIKGTNMYDYRAPYDIEGYGYLSIYTQGRDLSYYIGNCVRRVLKNPAKMVKETDIKFDLPKVYEKEYERGYGYRRNKETLRIEFLDVE